MIYLNKAKDALRDMSKWLQEKQMTAYEVTYQGKTKTLQEWTKGVSLRDKARLGPEERINFRDVVNVISGLALNNQFNDLSPGIPDIFGARHRVQSATVGGQCAESSRWGNPHQRRHCRP